MERTKESLRYGLYIKTMLGLDQLSNDVIQISYELKPSMT